MPNADYKLPTCYEESKQLLIDHIVMGDEKFYLTPDQVYLPDFDSAKSSTVDQGLIKNYAANTNRGILRNYNEDRVSIILNITGPSNSNPDDWPSCSFFAVYDGHGGATCSDFLRDNLHRLIIRQNCFPKDPVRAIKLGF